MISILKSEEWEYLAEGEMHFVIKYIGTNPAFEWKVLRIKKMKNQTESERKIDSMLLTILFKYLSKIQLFENCLMQSETITLPEEEKSHFLDQLWGTLQTKTKSNKKAQGLDYNVPIQIMNNLLDSRKFFNHTLIIEMKPKSPIYDKYQESTIQQISKQYNLSLQEVVEKIKQLPEKYYLVKNKRQIVNNKIHNNSMDSCSFFRGEKINYLGQNKILHQYYYNNDKIVERKNFPFSDEELNLALNTALNQSDILNKLLAVIHLYTKSFSRIKQLDTDQAIEVLKTLDEQKLINTLASKTLENYKLKKFKESNDILDTEPLVNDLEKRVQQILQYLLSTTFRDISILIQLQIRGKNHEDPIQINSDFSADYKLIIFDYELKSYYRTKGKYIHENQQILKKLFPMILKKEVALV